MPIRNVVLTEHQEEIIDRLVKSGRYRNASEVLREGLHLIEQREARGKVLRDAARVGFAELDAGQFVDVPGDELEDYIGRLGRTAASRVRHRAGR